MRAWLVLLSMLAVLAGVTRARAQAADGIDLRKEQARAHFERGAALVRDQAWEPALAEFLLSRELYPTRGNTQNAAVCLRQLRRYDEALDMLEALLAKFPSVPPADRAAAEDEIKELRALIGAIDVRANVTGAQVQIDDRARGTTPLAAPVRVPAGSHAVRVYKQGFAAFTARVEVAGSQTLAVDARLDALRVSGTLTVSEPSGKSADVLVDGIAVGKTPWEGALPPGRHTVSLVGDEGLGAQPAEIDVREGTVTPLSLALEPLEAELRVAPTPIGAAVALDGVAVGSGVWSGRVKSGGHRIEVAESGFLPQARSVLLAPGQRETLEITLDRDPESPLWGRGARGRFVLDATLGPASGSSFGGEVTSACSGACSTGLPLGVAGAAHAGYELRYGLGFALDAGYLATYESAHGRALDATPRGRAPIAGTADDALALRGLTLGASLAYHTAWKTPLLVRFGAGALLGEARDARTANFAAGQASGAETTAASYAYVAPEVRLGWKLGDHVELGAGVQAMILVALAQPNWTDQDQVLLGRDFVSFGAQSMVSSLLVVVTPSVGVRYEL